MPDNQRREKIDTLRAHGAEVKLIPAVPYKNPDHFVHTSGRLAAELNESEPAGAFWANQIENLANRDFHERTTGAEIWQQTGGRVDGFVCSVGTGGSLAGIARALKARHPDVTIDADRLDRGLRRARGDADACGRRDSDDRAARARLRLHKTDHRYALLRRHARRAFGAEHSSLQANIEIAVAAEDFVLTPDPLPEEVLFIRSDQFSFVRQGIPSVYLVPGFTSTDPDIDGESLFRQHLKAHYHRPSDDSSRPVHWPSALRFARANVRIGHSVAEQETRPNWNEGISSARNSAPTRRSAHPGMRRNLTP